MVMYYLAIPGKLYLRFLDMINMIDMIFWLRQCEFNHV